MVGEFIGIDVSKARLDVALLIVDQDGQEKPSGLLGVSSVDNDETGIQTLLQKIAALPIQPTRIVLEATGGYQSAMVAALALADLPVVVVNPRPVRDFAKADGKLAKTDKIDARVLAAFGARMHAEPQNHLPDEETELLRARVGRRHQLIGMITQEKNRLKQPQIPSSIRKEIQECITFLTARVSDIDRDIDDQIQKSPLYKENATVMRSVKGIGPVVTATLLADVPELGTLNRRKISSLIGLAPFPCDSGTMRGKRVIVGGRAHVRSALYMAATVAIRFNPILSAHYRQLRARGKVYKVAIVACMRKLLTILDAMMRAKTTWRDSGACEPC